MLNLPHFARRSDIRVRSTSIGAAFEMGDRQVQSSIVYKLRA